LFGYWHPVTIQGWVLIFYYLFDGCSWSVEQTLPACLVPLLKLVWMVVTKKMQMINTFVWTFGYGTIFRTIFFDLVWVQLIRIYVYVRCEYRKTIFNLRWHMMGLDGWYKKTLYQIFGNLIVVQSCTLMFFSLTGIEDLLEDVGSRYEYHYFTKGVFLNRNNPISSSSFQ
jgi:hypothetical protein